MYMIRHRLDKFSNFKKAAFEIYFATNVLSCLTSFEYYML